MRPSLFLLLLLVVAGKAWATEPDYKPLTPRSVEVAGAHGNLDVTARRFAILKNIDSPRQRITLLVDGEKDPKEWALSPGAELRCAGWWGRLDQFKIGDRVWIWFEKDHARQPAAVAFLADELSEQDLYAPVTMKSVNAPGTHDGTVSLETVRGDKPVVRTVKLANAEVYRGDAAAPHKSLKVGETVHVQTTGEAARLILDHAAFETRRAAQKAVLRKRWTDEGLPGTLIFSHSESREVELMLDHEGMRWGRSLQVGDKVTLQAGNAIAAVVRQLRPWRERTQIRLGFDCCSDQSTLTVGQRVSLRLAAPPAAADDDGVPTGLDKSRSKPERVEWLASSVYCTCGMHDGCAGHVFTLAACNSGPSDPCGLAKRTRKAIAEMIDKGQTDRKIFDELLKERGPTLLRPHMSP